MFGSYVNVSGGGSKGDLKTPCKMVVEDKPVSIVNKKKHTFLKNLSDEQLKDIGQLPYALPSLVSAVSKTGRSANVRTKGRGKQGKKAYPITQPIFPPPAYFLNQGLVYRICKTVDSFAVINGDAVLPQFTANYFILSAVGDATSLGSVFDQYRIALVEARFVPEVTENNVFTNDPGLFHSVVDFDDASVLTTLAEATDYSNCITTTGVKEHKHVFVPHVAVAAYSGAFTSFENQAAPWIDMNSPSVQHYGVKTAWSISNAGIRYRLIARLWIEFRSTR